MMPEISIDNIPTTAIRGNGVVSQAFMALGITDLQSAFRFVQQLPYRRNAGKAAVCVVLDEGCGTCSAKHALLARLAAEQEMDGLQLYTGIFRMDGQYAPVLQSLLEQHQLPYIPEAHCYLKYNNAVLDCTTANAAAAQFLPLLETELPITPEQAGDFKISFHKDYLLQCIATVPAFMQLNPDELWAIREEAIRLLSLRG